MHCDEVDQRTEPSNSVRLRGRHAPTPGLIRGGSDAVCEGVSFQEDFGSETRAGKGRPLFLVFVFR